MKEMQAYETQMTIIAALFIKQTAKKHGKRKAKTIAGRILFSFFYFTT
jgi:hypothetical protein